LYAYPKYLVALSPSGIISHVTMASGLANVLQAISVRYPDFKLKAGEVAQIKAVMSDLLEKGMTTKNASRELTCLGSRMIFLLARACIEKAQAVGCRN
jgi:hypothetical protein